MDRNETLDRLERGLIAGLINRRTFIVGAMATGLLLSSAVPALADELDAMREAQARNLRSLKRSYDYIVVGAGSAGCALVGTLAKREPSAQILLDRGGRLGYGRFRAGTRGFGSPTSGPSGPGTRCPSPSASTNNHPVPEYNGRVVGGGSSINATIWARPFKADLDHWAAETGDPRWGYENGLRLFKSIENWRGNPTRPSAVREARSGFSPQPTLCPWRPRAWKVSASSACPCSTTSTANARSPARFRLP